MSKDMGIQIHPGKGASGRRRTAVALDGAVPISGLQKTVVVFVLLIGTAIVQKSTTKYVDFMQYFIIFIEYITEINTKSVYFASFQFYTTFFYYIHDIFIVCLSLLKQIHTDSDLLCCLRSYVESAKCLAVPI